MMLLMLGVVNHDSGGQVNRELHQDLPEFGFVSSDMWQFQLLGLSKRN